MINAPMNRRGFLKHTSTAVALGAVLPGTAETAFPAPAIQTRTVKPVVISDFSGFSHRNGGTDNAVERANRIWMWREREHPRRDAFPGDPREWEKKHAETAKLTELGEKLLGFKSWG